MRSQTMPSVQTPPMRAPLPSNARVAQLRPPSTTVVLCLMAVLLLIWSSTWLVIKTGVSAFPPLACAALRFGLAGVVLAALAPKLAVLEGGDAPGLWLTLTQAVLQVAVNYGIVYWTEVRLPSGLVSLLWSIYPLLMALAGHLFLPGERVSGRQWLGFGIGLLGMVLLFATDVARSGPEMIGVGALLLVAPLAVVVSSGAVRKYGRDVSSILLNRNGMLLGADPTVVYAALLANRYNGVIHQSDLDSDSPYNTYRVAGLPPGPIANPGRASLAAALHPQQTDYLYFVSDNNGHHRFARTGAEHDRNVALYRRSAAGR